MASGGGATSAKRAKDAGPWNDAPERTCGLPTLIAHEFRTPLSIIDAAAQLIDIYGRPPHGAAGPEARAELAKIHRAVGRLRGLVDAYLAEDRIGGDTLPFHPAPVDLAEVAGEVCRTHARLTDRRVEFRTSGVTLTSGDPELLRILLDNLVINALKFSPPSTPVTVAVLGGGNCVEATVSDHGPGIAAEERKRIFDKYFRGEAAEGLHGIGLGLHLVRRILDLHGGGVTLDSALGRGSTFTVRLPVAAG